MHVTDIRIRRTYQDSRLKALVSVTVDGDLAVHDIKVIEGPSRKDENGTFRDIAHPITPQARRALETAILDAYRQYLDHQSASSGQLVPDHPVLPTANPS